MKKYKKNDEYENYMVSALALERHYGGGSKRLTAHEIEKTAIQATERRLYALPILMQRIEDNKEELEELESCGTDALRGHSMSLVRLIRPGMRLDPDEVHEAQLAELRARLAADEREVKKLQAVLWDITEDPYYPAIDMKYIKGATDAEIAKKLCCDPSTVGRNRARLLKRMAIRLYGSPLL
ncbi:MAG: hypothetical protein IJO48_00605 [Clostridia bacterium]|nr:hypothetical protein [Clostridia bacterium]